MRADPRLSRWRRSLVVLSLGATALARDCRADEYLDAIQREVQGLESAAPVSPPRAAPSVTAPAAEGQEAFERRLREAFPGSYFLYKRLAPDRRAAVFSRYRETGDLAVARDTIIDLGRAP